MLVHTCNPSTCKACEFEASLGYIVNSVSKSIHSETLSQNLYIYIYDPSVRGRSREENISGRRNASDIKCYGKVKNSPSLNIL
jgi:hypothetical protein